MSTRYDLSDPEGRENGLAAAVGAVRRGQLVVLPTDTVYGIGVDAFDPDGVQRLLDAKGRGRDMPPPVLISAATTLEALATDLPPLGRGAGRALLARPAHARVPPAALAAVGPRRDPRHRRRPDARRPGRPRPARPHRPAGGLLGQRHGRAGRHRRRRGRADAGRARSRSSSTAARAPARRPPRSSTAPATRPRILREGALDRARSSRRPLLDGARRRPSSDGRGPTGCVSTSWSSWWPGSSATCSASSPASSRSARAPSPGCATATCTRPRSPTSGASRCSAASARACCSPGTCRS